MAINKKEKVRKTVVEWLEELPSPYKEMAVYCALKECVSNEVITALEGEINEGVRCSLSEFDWEATEQGYKFWNQVDDALLGQADYPEIPDPSKRKVLKGFFSGDYDGDIELIIGEGITIDGMEIGAEKALELAAIIQEFFKDGKS